MSNWHTQRTAEIASMQHRLYAKTDAGHRFQMNESVQLTGKLVSGAQMLPPYITGRVTAVTEDEVTVAFEGYGEIPLSHAIAADYLQLYRNKDQTDALRSLMVPREGHAGLVGKGPRTMQELEPGTRVTDGRGGQYVVERTDPVRRTVVVSDAEGRVVSKAAIELKVLTEDVREPGRGERQTVGSDGVAPGTKATVIGIDPRFNERRAHAIQQGEASGLVGQTGTIIAAMYPTGAGKDAQGETMYTVLFPMGAKKSLSAKELQIAESVAEGTQSLTEARGTPTARRSLPAAPAQRPPVIALTEDMQDALEEGYYDGSNSKFSRKHYELIGDVLSQARKRGLTEDDHQTLVHEFGSLFKNDNPSYVHHRFVARASGADYMGPRSRAGVVPTTKHFRMVAEVLKRAHISQENRARAIEEFTDTFGARNSKFHSNQFRAASGGDIPAPPERIGDVSGGKPKIGVAIGEAATGGMAPGSVVKQPKPVVDAAPKPSPAAKAAVPPKVPAMPKIGEAQGGPHAPRPKPTNYVHTVDKSDKAPPPPKPDPGKHPTHPEPNVYKHTRKIGETIRTKAGKGVVMGEIEGKLQVALDSGEIVLLDEAALAMLPAHGQPYWVPPEVPNDKDTPPLQLGDLVSYDGVPGVVAELTDDGARVLLDNGHQVMIEAAPPAPSGAAMPKPALSTAKPTTTSTPTAMPTSLSPATNEAEKKDEKDEDPDDDGDDDKKKKKRKDGDKDEDDKDEKEPDDDKDDKKVTESVLGMRPMPSFKTSAPSMHREMPAGQAAEGSTIMIDGQPAQILGFTRFDQNLMPTEARVSLAGEEKLVALSKVTPLEERATSIGAGIRKTLQRLSKERPQPIMQHESRERPPTYMRGLVESVRLGKGLGTGGAGAIAPSDATLALEQQLNAAARAPRE